MENYRLFYYQPGPQVWQQVPLTGQSFSIGRTPENNLALPDEQVSRQHALLRLDAQGVWIIDQHSGNGVLMGGQRIPPGQWQLLPLGENFIMGATTLRVAADAPAQQPARPHQAGYRQTAPPQPPRPAARLVPPVSPPPRRKSLALPLVGILIGAACVCLVGGAAVWMFLPRLLSPQPTTVVQPSQPTAGQPTPGQPTPGQPAAPAPASAPPTVIDSLAASAGGGSVQDDQGVSLTVPPNALETGQQAYLERASLSQGMQRDIEQAYQVESLVYAVRLKDGQDGIGRVELALPAKSPNSRLAMLVDDRWLGILETPAQNGVFHLTPSPALTAGAPSYPEPGAAAEQAPNRYLVLTPKTGSGFQSPPDGDNRASLVTQIGRFQTAQRGSSRVSLMAQQTDADGKSCIAEFWTANHCWRDPTGSVYVFWQNDVPAALKDQEYLRIVDTVKAVAALMSSYQQKGFTAAAISPSNPAYVIIEAGASEPYYSFKTGNVYIPWDIIGGIGDAKNRCTMAHEFFHWIEDEEYRMGIAALSGPKAWWLETSAENGSFLLDSSCIDKNLTQYGLVNTGGNVLGFQAAPLQWEGGEQARYVHALQLYLSLCEGGANCALSQTGWTQAINNGDYPMAGSAVTAYENNAKDLGRFLLGAPPLESRGGAVIPPSARSGNGFGDYLALRTSPRGIWDFGLTMNQFNKASEQQVKVTAKIAKGGVYPLWVSNGTGTPMGGRGGNTGLPGLLDIQAGPAFWLKQDQAEPVFYPAGTSLKLGPISDKLGVGAARVVAVAPDGEQTFQANLSLADFSGDWSANWGKVQVTPIDCPGYSEADSEPTTGPDQMLQYFSGFGAYVKNAADPNLTWQGTLPEKMIGSSEVTVGVDKVTLHYRLDMPEPTDSGSLPSWLNLRRGLALRSAPPRSQWLMLWSALPILGLVAWPRRRPKRVGLALTAGLLIFAAFWLNGCVAVWGNIDVTYTFDKLEYINPPQTTAGGAGQPELTWKLINGQMVYVLDLTVASETTGADGTTVKKTEPCKLSATSSAVSGAIGPDGSVAPPDIQK